MKALNVKALLGTFDEHWHPRVIGRLNGQEVRIAKLLGEFDWHRHDDAEELFYIVEGEMVLRFREREVPLRAGDLCIVPRGAEHQPYAERECHVLLFEPEGTRNTGNLENERTVQPIDLSE